MCKNHPKHKNDGVIFAKIWLIGRAYAAAIERRKKYLKMNNDDFYEKKVINAFKKSGIDEEISRISEYKNITENNILDILKVHKSLINLVKEITDLEKRSLASKYLHFHLPDLFFIYDTRAASALRKISNPLKEEFKAIINDSKVDKEYAKYFCRSFVKMGDLGCKISVRQFDNVLIKIANKTLKKGGFEND